MIEEIQRGGVLWCSGTVWQGRTAMRISVSSWATTAADVERSLDGIRAAVGEDLMRFVACLAGCVPRWRPLTSRRRTRAGRP